MGAERREYMRKTVAITALGLVSVGALLGGCGEPKAVPMNDEYAGDSGETSESPSTGASEGSSAAASQSASGKNEKKDTGNYKDGQYSINGTYGPVGEDTIDVHLTIASGKVTGVEVIGHPFTSISKQHQEAFAKAIPGVIKGKPLKGLKVDKVAGASWTTEAFNSALDVARQEASIQ